MQNNTGPFKSEKSNTTSCHFVVGIGASAGGLDPIREIVRELPESSNMAFIVVQHLAEGNDTLLAELLNEVSSIPVITSRDGMVLECDHVYVAPPQSVITVEEGRIKVRDVAESKARRRTIDAMFRSLAKVYGEWTVGIILSGNDADGTDGLKEIGRRGGLTIAQNLEDAEFEVMPRSALESGAVDQQVMPADIPARVTAYYNDLNQMRRDRETNIEQRISELISEITHRVRLETGHDFSHYKTSTLVRRIQRRMRVLHIIEVDDYLEQIENEPKEARELFREVLISVTNFFRNPEAFDTLSEQVLAEIATDVDEPETIRIWVPGCATGEEVYTIAILLCEELRKAEVKTWPKLQLFGTDIDEEALHVARRGVYPPNIEAHLSAEHLERYFTSSGDHYQVSTELREICLFAEHNIVRDPPFVDLDLISCRNLLIYLNPYLQKQVLLLFHHSLRPTGFLFLGSSETVSPYADLFSTISGKYRIWRNTTDTGAPRPELPIDGAHSGEKWKTGTHDQAKAGVELHEQFQHIMTEKYAPRGVVVRRSGQIVYASNRLEKYLQIPRGKFEDSLLKMVASGLRLGVRAALQKSVNTGDRIVHDDVTFEGEKGVQPARIIVQPMPDTGYGNGLYLVVFEEVGSPINDAHQELDSSEETERLIAHLEHELESTREHLEFTVQDLEASNEELKSSNEELRSMNEELQATNEELESSKTEVVESHEKLASAKADLENLLYSAQLATLFLSEDYTIEMFTPPMVDIYRLRPSDEGRPLADITHHGVEMQPLPSMETVKNSSKPITDEIRTTDGKWFYRRVLPYITENGDMEGIIVTFTDISKLKSITEELQQRTADLEEARQKAEAGNQAKSEFLAKISHEIRTPMTAILGFSEILRGRLDGQEDIDAVDTIIRNANFLLEIINDILDLSKIEENEVEINNRPFVLRELIADIIGSMQVQAEQKGVDIKTDIASNVPDCIHVDPTRVRQILVNLLGNAIRFTDEGQVELRVQYIYGDDPILRCDVIDTGIGMSPKIQQQIFEPFMQADQMTNNTPGTGLGLTIIQRLIEELGGTINVDSARHRGSTFSVEIPVAPVTAEEKCDDAAKSGDIGSRYSGKKETQYALGRVLVVDDNADIRRMIKLFLGDLGGFVEGAADGREALQAVADSEKVGEPFDAVIMDMHMPNMDGYEATRRLRESGFRQPIIALTASAMCGDAQRCFDAGCTEYLSKPISPETLLPCIKEHSQSTMSDVDVDN